jgi:uncharacterized membrane protein
MEMTHITTDTHLLNPPPGEYLVDAGVIFTVRTDLDMRSEYNEDGTRTFTFTERETENQD